MGKARGFRIGELEGSTLLAGTTPREEPHKIFGLNVSAIANNKSVSLSSDSLAQVHPMGNQVLGILTEWSRSLLNSFVAERAGLSLKMCPGVVEPSGDNGKENGEKAWHFSLVVW